MLNCLRAAWLGCALCLLSAPLIGKADPAPTPVIPKASPVPRQTRCVELSPSGKVIAVYNHGKNQLQFLDVKTLKPLTTSKTELLVREGVCAFTPNGKYFVAPQSVNTNPDPEERPKWELKMGVWDGATGKLLRHFPFRYEFLRTGKFHAVSNTRIVCASMTSLGTVYDIETGKELGSFPGLRRAHIMCLSADGKKLLTCEADNDVCLWDVDKFRFVRVLSTHSSKVQAFALSHDGTAWVSVTAVRGFSRVAVMDFKSDMEIKRTQLSIVGVDRVHFTRDDKTIVATGLGYGNGGVSVWDWKAEKYVRGGKPIDDGSTLKLPSEYNSCSSLATDGKTLMTYSNASGIRLWDLSPPKK